MGEEKSTLDSPAELFEGKTIPAEAFVDTDGFPVVSLPEYLLQGERKMVVGKALSTCVRLAGHYGERVYEVIEKEEFIEAAKKFEKSTGTNIGKVFAHARKCLLGNFPQGDYYLSS